MGGVRKTSDTGIRLQAHNSFHSSVEILHSLFPSREFFPSRNDPVFNYAFSANPLRDVTEAAGFIHRAGVEESGEHVLPYSTRCLLCLSKRILRRTDDFSKHIPLKGTNGRSQKSSRYRNSSPGAVNERHGFSINIFSVVTS
ncbi:hypothetical protein CEXT_566471 [Caerostris extrusa]|uniref:Uncharacterized protein n=1 Tax=Caerostris extrusa TaxID=172846 RepID=A0AAV4UMM4_CAEEX|nr:hypothetical protein CEXT_566471 [Caerostris extrusa]